MKINIEKLREAGACESGLEWLRNLGTLDAESVIQIGIKQGKHIDVCYGLSFAMNKKQRVTWAIFCAELCLDNFEKVYPADGRPRKAIEAAKFYLDRPFESAASSARSAARSVASEKMIKKAYEILTKGEKS